MLLIGVPFGDTGAVFTMDDIVTRALARDPELEIARLENLARTADADAAQTRFLPTVSASANATHNGKLPSSTFAGRTVVFGSEDQIDLTGRVDQIIFSGGKLTSEVRIVEIAELVGRLRLRAKTNEITARARELYYEVLRTSGLHRASMASLLAATAHRNDAEAHVRAGVAAGVEIIRADVRVKEAALEETTRRTRASLARSRLATFLGLSTSAAIDIAGDFSDVVSRNHLDDPESSALRFRPDLVALRADAWAARERIRIARAVYLPNVSAFGSATYSDDDQSSGTESWKVGLAGNWEFFNWGRTGHQVRAASFRAKASSASVRDFEDEVRIQVRESVLAIENAKESIQTAQQRIKSAEEDLRISNLRFNEGLGTGTEVIDAESTHAAAVAQLINARAELALAENNYWFVTGGSGS